MSRWRVATVLILWLTPFALLIGVGGSYLWQTGWTLYTSLFTVLCFGLAFGLAWHWQRKRRLMPAWNLEPLPHGSQRDQEAWKLVERRAKEAESIPAAQFTDPAFYTRTGQELALELARFYHPDAQDPYGKLTVPELLTVAELAAKDLADLVQRYVPGSHMLTIDDYKTARQAVDWYRRANNLYWIASAVFSPIETAARYLASRVATGSTWNLLQQNVLLWFYTAFLNRLGTYLIELHSGRLRVGAARYRELIARHQHPEPGAVEMNGQPELQPAREVTIAVVGQVKAGKSSLINALLGQQQAQTDILPLTNEITRYQLQPAGIDSRLVLLDTSGYGHEGPREDQLKATEEAARQADALLLVLHARNPARAADVQLVDRLKEWFAANPNLRMPPIVGVMTHIDLLTPAMEWAPPYNWRAPTRPKEEQIQQALQVGGGQFGGRLVALVPVCSVAGKEYGVEGEMMPALAQLLGEARTVALLRCLKAEADTAKLRRVFWQLLDFGVEAARIILQKAGK
jgi:uncharacterized protein